MPMPGNVKLNLANKMDAFRYIRTRGRRGLRDGLFSRL